MALEWKPVENQAKGNDYAQMAKEFIQNPIQAFDLSQFRNDVSPQEYLSSQTADKIFNSQLGLVERLNQKETELEEVKQQNQTRLNDLMSRYEQAVKPTVTGSSAITQDYLNSKKPTQTSSKWAKFDTAHIMYDTFIKNGLNHNQALGLLMNVQAENDLGDKYVFGTHQDGSKTAYGALSWQGGREVGLLKKLASNGLYDPNKGRIVQDPRAIALQAEYMVEELKSGRQGNYLAYTGRTPLDYARYANKTYTRSNQSPTVLAGREKAYARLLNSRDWNTYLNQHRG